MEAVVLQDPVRPGHRRLNTRGWKIELEGSRRWTRQGWQGWSLRRTSRRWRSRRRPVGRKGISSSSGLCQEGREGSGRRGRAGDREDLTPFYGQTSWKSLVMASAMGLDLVFDLGHQLPGPRVRDDDGRRRAASLGGPSRRHRVAKVIELVVRRSIDPDLEGALDELRRARVGLPPARRRSSRLVWSVVAGARVHGIRRVAMRSGV